MSRYSLDNMFGHLLLFLLRVLLRDVSKWMVCLIIPTVKVIPRSIQPLHRNQSTECIQHMYTEYRVRICAHCVQNSSQSLLRLFFQSLWGKGHSTCSAYTPYKEASQKLSLTSNGQTISNLFLYFNMSIAWLLCLDGINNCPHRGFLHVGRSKLGNHTSVQIVPTYKTAGILYG